MWSALKVFIKYSWKTERSWRIEKNCYGVPVYKIHYQHLKDRPVISTKSTYQDNWFWSFQSKFGNVSRLNSEKLQNFHSPFRAKITKMITRVNYRIFMNWPNIWFSWKSEKTPVSDASFFDLRITHWFDASSRFSESSKS